MQSMLLRDRLPLIRLWPHVRLAMLTLIRTPALDKSTARKGGLYGSKTVPFFSATLPDPLAPLRWPGDTGPEDLETSSAMDLEALEEADVLFKPRPPANLGILDEIPNIGPVCGCDIVDLAQEESPQMYALCGKGGRSTLRTMRHGPSTIAITAKPQSCRRRRRRHFNRSMLTPLVLWLQGLPSRRWPSLSCRATPTQSGRSRLQRTSTTATSWSPSSTPRWCSRSERQWRRSPTQASSPRKEPVVPARPPHTTHTHARTTTHTHTAGIPWGFLTRNCVFALSVFCAKKSAGARRAPTLSASLIGDDALLQIYPSGIR